MNRADSSTPALLIAVIVLQAICAGVFLIDGFTEILAADTLETSGHREAGAWLELTAAIGLVAAILYETRFLTQLLRRQAHLERQVTVASAAFHDVIDSRFTDWALTASERDVAHFTVKGCSIPEIAQLRGSAEGTVKSHLGAIYRKAGVANRGELLSLLIEDLLTPAEAPGTADTHGSVLPRGA